MGIAHHSSGLHHAAVKRSTEQESARRNDPKGVLPQRDPELSIGVARPLLAFLPGGLFRSAEKLVFVKRLIVVFLKIKTAIFCELRKCDRVGASIPT
jgi:hypothetical protein